MKGLVCVDRKRRCDLAVTFGVTLGCCRRNCITHSPNNSLLLPLSIFRAELHHTRRARGNSFLIDPQTKVLISLFANSRAASTQHLLQIDVCETRARERKMRLLCVALCSNNMGARACESLLR